MYHKRYFMIKKKEYMKFLSLLILSLYNKTITNNVLSNVIIIHLSMLNLYLLQIYTCVLFDCSIYFVMRVDEFFCTTYKDLILITNYGSAELIIYNGSVH